MDELTFYGDFYPHKVVKVEAAFPKNYVLNLEAPLTSASRGYPGKVNLRGSPEVVTATLTRLPMAVCLANNHIMDFGDEGFFDTLAYLEQQSIAYFGAGPLEDNCNNPLIIKMENVKVGMMGYVCPTTSPVLANDKRPGCMPISLETIQLDIERARQMGAERIIVHLHWGAEQVSLPKPEDVETARGIVDLGADLIIGHHAHCIQAFEEYKNASIFYGLGNWIFPEHISPSYFSSDGIAQKLYTSHLHEKNRRSLAVKFELEEKTVQVMPNYFDGEILRQGNFGVGRYRYSFDAKNYSGNFTRAFRLGKIKHYLDNYFASPKLPNIRHLKSVFRLLRTKRYQ